MATATKLQTGEIRIQVSEIAQSGGTRTALVVAPSDGGKPRVTSSASYPPHSPTAFEPIALTAVVGSWAINLDWNTGGDPSVDILPTKKGASANAVEATYGTKHRSIIATVENFGDKPELKASGDSRPVGAPECDLRMTLTAMPYTARVMYKKVDEAPKLEIEDATADMKAAAATTRAAQQEALMKALQIECKDPVTGTVSYVPAYTLDERKGEGLETWQRNPHASYTETVVYRLDPAKEAGISLLAEKMD